MSNTTHRRLERKSERLARKRETLDLIEEHRTNVILDAEELAEIHREWNEWDANHRGPMALDDWEMSPYFEGGRWSRDPLDDWAPEPVDDWAMHEYEDWGDDRSSYGRDPLDPLY